MARGITSPLAPCHKLLPAALLLAVLIAGVSQQSLADSSLPETSASANVAGGGSGGGLEGSASGSANLGVARVSGSASIGGGSGRSGISMSMGASGSSSSGSSDSSSSAGASASISGSSTPKPEGLLSKMKEMVKSGVDSLTHEEKKDNSMAQSGSAAQASGSLGSGSEVGASPHTSGGGSSSSGDGLVGRFKDAAKEMKDDVKSSFKGGSDDKSSSSSSSSSSSGDVKIGTANSNVQIGSGGGGSSGGSGGESRSGLSNMVHKAEDKATEIGDKIKKPFQEVSKDAGSGISKLVHKVEDKASEIGNKIKKPFQDGKQGGGPRSSTSASGNNEGSLAVELLDKSHDVVKDPLEKALKPLDKALGYKEDPLIKMYDTGHEKLRHPLAMISKPVEAVFSGAFKTSDESLAEAQRSRSEEDRREAKMREERLRKEGRSILGEISDKSVELAEKPIEIILRPIDQLLGFDKEGKKNPLIQAIDELYGFSKKPIDALAKPFENILRQMAGGEQAYQVSVRINGAESSDPKLITRLADGALNIADRIITRPIEIAMRPLGFGQSRKNPIVDATHSLKNATRLGVELFTRPIDRIIKEIADIGATKNEAEREAMMERKRQEASRIVHALDKLHEISQTPWEIVLRPVGKVLGYNKEGKKDPALRAWDIVHQVLRTPIQVLSRPLEDAILGETKRQQSAPKQQARAEVAMGQAQARKHNFFTDQIRKMEKLATKPLDVMTSPIRRLILGEDNGPRGAGASAKAQVGGVQAKVSTGSSGGPDKIVKTIEQVNNVVLKPFEVITQPISDIIAPENKQPQKKVDVKASASISASGQGRSGLSAAAPTSASQQRGPSAPAAAQMKSG